MGLEAGHTLLSPKQNQWPWGKQLDFSDLRFASASTPTLQSSRDNTMVSQKLGTEITVLRCLPTWSTAEFTLQLHRLFCICWQLHTSKACVSLLLYPEAFSSATIPCSALIGGSSEVLIPRGNMQSLRDFCQQTLQFLHPLVHILHDQPTRSAKG